MSLQWRIVILYGWRKTFVDLSVRHPRFLPDEHRLYLPVQIQTTSFQRQRAIKGNNYSVSLYLIERKRRYAYLTP